MSCLTAVISAPLSLWLSSGGFFSPVRWASWPDCSDDSDGVRDHVHYDDHGDDGDDDDVEQGEPGYQIIGRGPVVGLRAWHQQREGDPSERRQTQAGAAAAVLLLRWRGGKLAVSGRTGLLKV